MDNLIQYLRFTFIQQYFALLDDDVEEETQATSAPSSVSDDEDGMFIYECTKCNGVTSFGHKPSSRYTQFCLSDDCLKLHVTQFINSN